jgi:hypothetical protein
MTYKPTGFGPQTGFTTNPKPKHKQPARKPSNSPYRTILFFGQDFFDSSNNTWFNVLAGDQPPTITGGYAKWQTIDLPLRRGQTVFQGYDPVIMEMSVRFIELDSSGSWLTDEESGKLVEGKIGRLEWMAGESYSSGPPPKVTLSTYDGSGVTNGLIPLWYQTETKVVPGYPGTGRLAGVGNVGPWIITSLVWDKAPIRGDHGFRIRQDATVTAQLYTGVGAAKTGLTRPKASVFISRAGADTPLLIARQEPTAFPQQLAQAIVGAPQNKSLHLRSWNQKIKHGAKVRVPAGN